MVLLHRAPQQRVARAAMTSCARALRLLSLNVNGMRIGPKRLTLFSELLLGGWDVIVLQETHHDDEATGLAWAREGAGVGKPWLGDTFWSSSPHNPRSGGVAVLFRDGAATSAVQRVCEAPGRALVVSFEHAGVAHAVVSVYAPVEPPQRQAFFLDTLLPLLPSDRALLVGGDFNCVSDAFDVLGGTADSLIRREVGYWGGLQHVQAARDLVDVYRELHPTGREITRAGPQSAARLDRWLVSRSLLGRLRAADVGAGVDQLPSDHRAVYIALRAGRQGPALGKGPWRFCLDLLRNAAYMEATAALLDRFDASHPVIAGSATLGTDYEELKALLREEAKRHMLARSRVRNAQEAAATGAVRAALALYQRHPTLAYAREGLMHARARRQALAHEAATAAARKAQVVWQHYGEQPTFWFHWLTRERQQQTTIAALRCGPHPDSPAVPLDAARRPQGAAALCAYFSGDMPDGLYAPRPTDRAAQDTLLGAVDMRMSPSAIAACLGIEGAVDGAVAPPQAPAESPASSARLAGELTEEELSAVCQRLPRGKAPGDDGLPYEFYVAFWQQLAPRLLAVLNAAFHSTSAAVLPLSMRSGRITLLYKGKGADRTQPSSYRPITLLNCDYKIAAAAIAARLGAPLSSVIDSSQTAFLPKRWIGDNVLVHLETIDYLQATGQPGAIVFLDLAKAFDRVDRAWILRSLEALGAPACIPRWVEVLHGGTCATVAYNGWVTDAFPVRSGVFQGSPLSPILYVAASQPLAAYTRSLATQGLIRPILLPSGRPAPLLHQHADDTTVHVRTRADARLVIDGPIRLFCRASGSLVQPSKSQGLEVCAPEGGLPFSGICPLTGISFVAGTDPVTHLGVLLGRDPATNAEAAYTALLERMQRRAQRYMRIDLAFFGRAYIAKQVLASMASHLSCFVTAPPQLLQRMTQLLCTFVAANRPHRPSANGTNTHAAALRPGRHVCALPWAWGGVNHVDIGIQTQALQARNVSRFLEPEAHAWKAFFAQWLVRDPAWRHAHPAVALRALDRWGLGLAALFFDVPMSARDMPQRVLAYIQAFRALRPHRACSVPDTPFQAMLQEPLFFNPRIRGPECGAPLSGIGWRPVAEAGVRRVCDLRRLLTEALPPGVSSGQRSVLLAALPQEWRAALDGDIDLDSLEWLLGDAARGDAAAWRRSAAPPGAGADADGAGAWWQPYTLAGPTGRLSPAATPPQRHPPPDARPALVMLWDAGRPWHTRKGTHAALVPSGAQPYLVGGWAEATVDPGGWLIGKEPCTQLLVKAANLRLQAARAMLAGFPNPISCPLRPAIWDGGLREAEARWRAALAGRGLMARGVSAAPAGQRTQRNPAFEAPWMHPPPPRAAPAERRARAAARAERAARRPPVPNDTADPLAPAGRRPAWAHVWAHIYDIDIDRRHRCTAFRILHGQLHVGMFAGYIRHHNSAEACCCPHPACHGAGQSLSHVFLDCVVALPVVAWLAQVWGAVTGQRTPPLSAAVLLAGDHRGWPLDAALQPLWTRLRLTTLWHLWRASRHGALDAGAQPLTAVRVASSILHDCRGAIQRDFMRVSTLIDCEMGVPMAWLRGRSPKMKLTEFQARWCHRGVLCRAPSDRVLELRWTAAHPVPLPAEGVG